LNWKLTTTKLYSMRTTLETTAN